MITNQACNHKKSNPQNSSRLVTFSCRLTFVNFRDGNSRSRGLFLQRSLRIAGIFPHHRAECMTAQDEQQSSGKDEYKTLRWGGVEKSGGRGERGEDYARPGNNSKAIPGAIRGICSRTRYRQIVVMVYDMLSMSACERVLPVRMIDTA